MLTGEHYEVLENIMSCPNMSLMRANMIRDSLRRFVEENQLGYFVVAAVNCWGYCFDCEGYFHCEDAARLEDVLSDIVAELKEIRLSAKH